MQQMQLAKWLKFITIVIGVIGSLFLLIIIPTLGKDFALTYPEFSYLFWPYIIWAWVIAVPCYIALIYLWKICNEIHNDNSFSETNSRSLQAISRLAIFDTVILLSVGIVFFLCNMLHPGLLILCFLGSVGGFAIAISAALLSHWVEKGRQLKEENDLTI